ncbi:MAG: hypothetical protein HQK55_04320 [Deltaproteobacteria bacterium]|nr:hypothetical protein [Deltaproteobacteria bacterium]
MSFFKLLLAFAPWISFLIISSGSLFRLKLGLIVALVLSIIMGVAKLHRGIILWVGLLFFTYATLVVTLLNDMWTIQHMGILANGALAISTWLSIAIKKPFTLDYARAHTDPSVWNTPLFIKTNTIVASIWGMAFILNTVLAWGKMTHFFLPEWGYEVVTYVFLVATAMFTAWYPKYVRQRQQQEVN